MKITFITYIACTNMIKYVGNRVEQLGMLPQVSECHLSRLTVEFVLVYE